MSDSQTDHAVSDAASAAAAERRDAAGLLGRRLVRLLAPLRVRRLSLHDAHGELLWLSQGEFGPEERRYIQDIQDAFGLEVSSQFLERELKTGRKALFFCARTPLGERSDLACAVISSRRRPDVDLEDIKSRVFAAMGRFSATAPGASAAVVAEPVPTFKVRSSRRKATAAEADAAAAQAAAAAEPSAYAFTGAPADAPADALADQPATGAAAAASGAEEVPLRSRAYSRLLRSGGATRRYEVAREASESTSLDLNRAGRLIQLLQKRGTRAAPAPASFTLPLCAASVLRPDFLAQLAPAFESAGLGEDMLGLCIPAAAWEQDLAATQRFIEQCAQYRCFVALDDFNLTRPGFVLLQSGALRCLKLDAALTANVPDDKFAHANLAAIVKAARVLGLYCVAKGVKTPAAARWMASAGIEYADRPTRDAGSAATTESAPALSLAQGS
jgi:EAL domain-containing protein (putative c-di-GMP-specific phosphodiesterase class I)